MDIRELITKSSVEQRKALLNKEVSAVELTEEVYKQVDSVDEKIGAYNSLTKDFALETAKKVDEKINKGEEIAPLAGIPLALKDNINLKSYPTTASSKILSYSLTGLHDATSLVASAQITLQMLARFGFNLTIFSVTFSNLCSWESIATKVAIFGASSSKWVVFPPGAAQQSKMVSLFSGLSNTLAYWALIS